MNGNREDADEKERQFRRRKSKERNFLKRAGSLSIPWCKHPFRSARSQVLTPHSPMRQRRAPECMPENRCYYGSDRGNSQSGDLSMTLRPLRVFLDNVSLGDNGKPMQSEEYTRVYSSRTRAREPLRTPRNFRFTLTLSLHQRRTAYAPVLL